LSSQWSSFAHFKLKVWHLTCELINGSTARSGVTRYHHDILQAAIKITTGYRMLDRLCGDHPCMAVMIVAGSLFGLFRNPGGRVIV
jgi:hypothetical protein